MLLLYDYLKIKLNFLKAFLMILSILIYSRAGAQFIVSGKLINQQEQPIEYAKISLTNVSDTTSIKMVLTDEKGKFSLSVAKGNYTFSVDYFKQKFIKKKLYVANNINLGMLKLNEVNQIEGVTVTGKKPLIERKADRLVFNVENSISASGGDALDALRATPLVRVQNNIISMVGKGGLRVMINDRILHLSGEDLTNYLQSLSADDIKRIEVITTPPAKYDAEGNSGLLNIVLKKAKRNYSGGAVSTTYKQQTYPYGGLNGNFTYQKNKWSAFSTLSAADYSYKITENSTIFYPDQQWNRHAIRKVLAKYLSGRTGIDYNLSSKTSIGIQYLGSISSPDEKERINTQVFRTGLNTLDSLLFTKANKDVTTENHALNGHFTTKIDSLGKNISVDIDYFNFNNDSERPYTYRVFEKQTQSPKSSQTYKNTSKQSIQNVSSKINVDWPTKILHLTFGGKISFSKTHSDIGGFNLKEGIFKKDMKQTDTFQYKENIQAAYVSLEKELKKWKFKAGLRMEATQTEGNSFTLHQVNKNDYIKLFPTVYVTYTPQEYHSFSANYSRRISRPGYASLNPFRIYDNPNAYTEGNPFLQPSFTDTWELSHLYKDNLYSAFSIYRITDDRQQFTLTDPKEKIERTVRKNFIDGWDFDLEQYYTVRLGKWLESSLTYLVNYGVYKSSLPQTIQRREGWSFYAAVNNSFYFNAHKTLSGSLNVWYDSPQVDGVDKVSESYNVDVGLRADIFKKKWRVSLVATDIFRSNINTISSYYKGIKQRYRNYYDQQTVRLSVRYRFGKKLKSKKREFSNEEERRRTGGGM